VLEETRPVGDVPRNMLHSDSLGGTGLGAKLATHPTECHTREEIVRWQDAFGAKHLVLRAVRAARQAKGQSPCMEQAQGRSEGTGARVTHKFLGSVGGGL
jgi:hypothetical protein